MNDAEFSAELERITARMSQVSLAKTLIKRGSFEEAIKILKSVRDKYSEETMVRMVDFLIRDVETKLEAAKMTLKPAVKRPAM